MKNLEHFGTWKWQRESYFKYRINNSTNWRQKSVSNVKHSPSLTSQNILFSNWIQALCFVIWNDSTYQKSVQESPSLSWAAVAIPSCPQSHRGIFRYLKQASSRKLNGTTLNFAWHSDLLQYEGSRAHCFMQLLRMVSEGYNPATVPHKCHQL